ncbi:6-phosphogluconolactonase [Pseudooceanicola sp. MF1-13]|uniref:6-phosphogluconolactonase n=1 Tax=Pseudooceanicola sp. MF1-13 TaxID=3379095 RepID=UPI003892874D
MNFKAYPDTDMLVLDLSDVLAASLNSALNGKERVTFAVPGGTTPGPVFDALSQVHLPWDRVDVVLTDERWVPESSDRSNTALLRRTLLKDAAAAATLIPLVADTDAPEDSLDALTEGLKPHLPIDVLLIGMGADMHCASLFPGADRLADALAHNAPPLMPMRAPGAPEPRITLTAPVLRGAIDTHIVITGAEKKNAIHKAQKLQPIDAPVAAILDGAQVHYAD